MNEKVDVEIFRRRLTIEIEGLTPMEIQVMAQKVNDKLVEVEEKYPKIADSQKLAIIAILEMSVEQAKEREAHDTFTRAMEHKIEELTVSLQSALAAGQK